MRKIFLLCLFFTSGIVSLRAQKNSIEFDHFALYVQNLDSSVAFYSTLLELDTIPTPFPGFPVKWYKIGNGLQLHIIQGNTTATALPILQHACFSIASIESFIARLKAANIMYYDGAGKPGVFQTRGDGVIQLFVKDPDGNWIEVNNRKH